MWRDGVGIDRSSWRSPSRKTSAVLATAVGGLTAGVLDLAGAMHSGGWVATPKAVAGGLLGRQALHGGWGIWFLGIFLHFFIACSAAAVYYASSQKLPFLKEYPLVCGLCFGAWVELVMNLIVLPLSALHIRGPFSLHYLVFGLLWHMVVVGLPISFSVRQFAQ